MSHTKEPWKINTSCSARSGEGFKISEFYVYAPDTVDDVAICSDVIDPVTQKPSEANARRIVACVNACAGLSTQCLAETGGGVKHYIEVIKQRDDLLAALEEIRHWFESERKSISKGNGSKWSMWQCEANMEVINGAINRAKGCAA